MKKRYVIKVTAKDIKNGLPEEGNFCAIALALKRKFKKGCYVDAEQISIGGYSASIPLQRDINKIDRFIENFDDATRRRYCRPFSFILTKDI